MPTNELTCPYCMYQAPSSFFESVSGGRLKCRRCRTPFQPPDAYSPDIAYADCDGLEPVMRYPFALNRSESVIHVREGYMALLTTADGKRMWLDGEDSRFTDSGTRLYYICLSPKVPWGCSVKVFGAYGYARLSLSREYVMDFCGKNENVLELKDHLQKIVNAYIAECIGTWLKQKSVGLLESKEFYLQITGAPEKGASIDRVDPIGFRSVNGKIGSFSYHLSENERAETPVQLPVYKPPYEIVDSPRPPYTIRKDEEEVFCYKPPKMKRYKAGERVDDALLRDVIRVVRFKAKEFEFPFGWGIYNQPMVGTGFFAAHGTVSFYIDSTTLFSQLLTKTKSWRDFGKQFFSDVLKKEIAAALQEVMRTRAGMQSFRAEQINEYLSAMSIDLTNTLNGEGAVPKEPIFRRYGLRVKQTDIFGVHFYDDRR